MAEYRRLALAVSDTDKAQRAAQRLRGEHDWVPLEEADAVVVLGGDGFMLQTLHAMLDAALSSSVSGNSAASDWQQAQKSTQ